MQNSIGMGEGLIEDQGLFWRFYHISNMRVGWFGMKQKLLVAIFQVLPRFHLHRPGPSVPEDCLN